MFKSNPALLPITHQFGARSNFYNSALWLQPAFGKICPLPLMNSISHVSSFIGLCRVNRDRFSRENRAVTCRNVLLVRLFYLLLSRRQQLAVAYSCPAAFLHLSRHRSGATFFHVSLLLLPRRQPAAGRCSCPPTYRRRSSTPIFINHERTR